MTHTSQRQLNFEQTETSQYQLLSGLGSGAGSHMRSNIMQERDVLVKDGKENLPRDSELSVGKFEEDMTKVKQARIRVQKRLIDKNMVNSSDEEDEDRNRDNAYMKDVDPAGGAGAQGGKTTVLHFKRNFKSGAAADARRRRAGRFGKRAGMDDSDSDSQDSDDESSEEEYQDEMDMPREEEFYRYDASGFRVSGRYTTEGHFIVEVCDRNVKGRCDKAGFLLNAFGEREQDLEMGDRIRRR